MMLSARGAQKTSNDTKKLQMYSKRWLPGDNMRLWVPIFKSEGQWEIAVGAIWGHKVYDFEGIGLKTTFIPSLTDFDENGEPIGQPDITYQFSLIAKAFVDGQKAIEERNIQSKNWPSDAARTDALRKLEDKYDAKNNMNAIKPAIGRVSYLISTEVLCCKVVNDVPQLDTLAVVSFPLSSQRIDELYTVMNDVKTAPEADDKFLEVEWKYPANADKAASARASHPNGVTFDYRFSKCQPEAWQVISGWFPRVANNSESIVKHATKKIDESKIRAALQRYSIINSNYLDGVPEDSEDTLLKHADVIHELEIVRSMNNQDLIEKINASFDEMKAQPTVDNSTTAVPDLAANIPDLGANVAPTPAPTQATAPTVDLGASVAQSAPTPAPATQPVDIGPAAPEAPNLSALMNNAMAENMDDADMMSVDLGAI